MTRPTHVRPTNNVGSMSGLVTSVDVVCVVILSVIAVGLHMAQYPRLSAFDEPTHIDYTLSLTNLEYPTLGEPYDQVTLREWACRGHHFVDSQLPDCESDEFVPGEFAGQGIQRNSSPPLYYAISALVAGPARAITGLSFVSLARLSGVLFLSIGSLGSVVASRSLGVRGISGLLSPVIVLGMPTVLHATSTVNSDGGVYAVGGVAAAVAARCLVHEEQSTRLFGLAMLVAVVAGLTKTTALFGVGILGLMLAGSGLMRGAKRRSLLESVAVLATGALVHAAWMAFAASRRPSDFVNPIGNGNGVAVEGGPIREIVQGADDLFPPTRLSWFPIPDVLQSSWQEPWAIVLGLVVVASALLAIAHSDGVSRIWGTATVVGCVASGMIVQAGLALGSRNIYFPEVNSRYGLALVPFVTVLIVAVADQRRWSRAVPAVLSAGSLVGFGLSVF